MLRALKVLFPIRIPAPVLPATSVTHEIMIEAQISDFPLYDPIIEYYNVSAEDTKCKLTRTLTLGVSTDALLSGSYSKDLVDTTVAAGQDLRMEFEHKFLTKPGVYPGNQHVITITNESAFEVIVYVFLTGRIWETLAQSPDQLPLIR
jgi:hypothetical protein